MAQPKLALIPATQGSKVFSVLPADGVGDFDFSRNSAATRINKDGLIETVASGVSRLNYPLIDGVVNGCPSHLLEPERLQKIQYSEDFSQSAWTKSGLLTPTSGFVSPKGDLSAFKLVEDTSNGQHFTEVSSLSILNTTKHTISFYVKYNGVQFIRIFASGLNANTYFDVLNGAIGSTTAESNKIELLSNGWYRCTMIDESISTSTSFKISLAESDGVVVYTGDGTSGVYIYGAQVEQGSYATSYIPNYGTSAGITRSAETANGAGDASTFNSSEGVLMAEISALDAAPTRGITLGDGTSNNRVQFYYNSSNVLNGNVINVSSQVTGFSYNGDSNIPNKVALKYKVNDFSFWVNGFKIEVDTNGITPVGLNTLNFDNGVGGGDFYGNTKQIQYFDSALNDSDLEKITSWTSFTDLANGQTYSIK